jgi:tetratricopeptide (TPR) repeat protein
MSNNAGAIETSTDIQEQEEMPDLYSEQVDNFERLLKSNPDEAYRRYGLSLFYSVSDENLINERQGRMGFPVRDGIDYYNMGVVESDAGNHRDALTHYRKAMNTGSVLPDLYYNIALTYIELGEIKEARKQLNRYLAIVEETKDDWSQEEKETVEEVQQYLESN